MSLNKHDKFSDALANLYRAAYYLAVESKEISLMFLEKSNKVLGKKIKVDYKKVFSKGTLKDKVDCRYWAEKILDEYKRIKMGLN